MSNHHAHQGPFDIPDIPNFVPRRYKPYLFIIFVLIIQFSGAIYLAGAADMIGKSALMQKDIMMAGYASFVGMSLNFALMFRFKFRFALRTILLGSSIILIAANVICAFTDSLPVLVITCFIAGWFRMQATFACNSTIQLWLTPVRDMSIFFCYVYLIVDSVIQLSGIATVYTAYNFEWEYMHWIMTGLLAAMMVAILIFIRPKRFPMYIPLLGIDWIGCILWAGFMLSTTYICTYGDFYDWWEATEIQQATVFGLACLVLNLWRATFLHHPYISFQAMTNRNVVRAIAVYLVFFTLLSTEHVFEHAYASTILGFDETNLIDLNWYVFAGVLTGCAFTFITFAKWKWRYKTMTIIGYSLATVYLALFYFYIDYGVEKEALFIPLFIRGASSVIISIVFLTSIVQSGLPFQVFPQALAINGYVVAVLCVTLGPAMIGELLDHTMANNAAVLSSEFTAANPSTAHLPLEQLYGIVQKQALIISMKEIYGILLMVGIISIALIAVSYSSIRPWAIFPKWKTIRRVVKRLARV